MSTSRFNPASGGMGAVKRYGVSPGFNAKLDRITGLWELDMHAEALSELHALSVDEQHQLPAQCLKLCVLLGLEKWEEIIAMTEKMYRDGSRPVALFTIGAQAIREKRSAKEALRFILQGDEFHSGFGIYNFFVARLLCVTGSHEAARARLERAISQDIQIRGMAAEEPDMEALR